MIHAVHGAAAEKAQVVCDLGEVPPVDGHVGTALTVFGKVERTLNIVALTALHGGQLLVLADELLKVKFF